MKVLLSAYACEPDNGSEPEVGWSWAHIASESAESVHVITRSNNKNVIECKNYPKNITFHFYDLPKWALKLKKTPKIGIYWYYHLWQIGAALFAKKLHRKENFNIVQHVTFVSIFVPSYMWILRIPFVFGPVGGAELTPKHLLTIKTLGFYGLLSEKIRLMRVLVSKLHPLLYICLKKAAKIIVVTKDSQNFIPMKFKNKSLIMPAISAPPTKINGEEKNQNILWAGRLIHWKGIRIFLDVALKLIEQDKTTRFKIIGSGKEIEYLNNFIVENSIEENFSLLGQLPQKEVFSEMSTSSCLLIPSLHDSGGYVVLEAITNNCPVVCLNTGGPGEIIKSKAHSKSISIDSDYDTIVSQLTDSVKDIIVKSKQINLDARHEIEGFFFKDEKVLKINQLYKEIIND